MWKLVWTQNWGHQQAVHNTETKSISWRSPPSTSKGTLKTYAKCKIKNSLKKKSLRMLKKFITIFI